MTNKEFNNQVVKGEVSQAEIDSFIDKIKSNVSKEDAHFGIYADNNSYISSNREGLLLFASEILTASVCEKKDENNDVIFDLDNESGWKSDDSDIRIDYINVSEKDDDETVAESRADKIKSQLFKTGCLTLMVIGLISLVVGVVTVFSWLINLIF